MFTLFTPAASFLAQYVLMLFTILALPIIAGLLLAYPLQKRKIALFLGALGAFNVLIGGLEGFPYLLSSFIGYRAMLGPIILTSFSYSKPPNTPSTLGKKKNLFENFTCCFL